MSNQDEAAGMNPDYVPPTTGAWAMGPPPLTSIEEVVLGYINEVRRNLKFSQQQASDQQAFIGDLKRRVVELTKEIEDRDKRIANLQDENQLLRTENIKNRYDREDDEAHTTKRKPTDKPMPVSGVLADWEDQARGVSIASTRQQPANVAKGVIDGDKVIREGRESLSNYIASTQQPARGV